MTVTDWRHYKIRDEDIKGFKGSKPCIEEKDAPLKPLWHPLRPCPNQIDFSHTFNNLDTLEPLEPLEPKGNELNENREGGQEQFKILAEQWTERAAIKEFDGGMCRKDAEEDAAKEYQLIPWLDDLRRIGERSS